MAMNPEYNFSVPEGITYPGNDGLQAKLIELAQAGTSNLHFVFDFDRTLTVRKGSTQEDITSWGILNEHLPPEAQKFHDELYERYRPLEINGSMTKEDAVEWWSIILDLFVSNNLDLRAVEADFLERASIRPGTKELFNFCRERQIPTVIMSAGIRDVIEIWNQVYGIAPSLVISTALEVDEVGRVVGWDRDTLVHALNKDEVDHDELNNIRTQKPWAVVVGDGMGDADMASGEENVLRVRIFDPRPDEIVDIIAEREKTFKRFDAMIENGSLLPLVELVQEVTQES